MDLFVFCLFDCFQFSHPTAFFFIGTLVIKAKARLLWYSFFPSKSTESQVEDVKSPWRTPSSRVEPHSLTEGPPLLFLANFDPHGGSYLWS